MKSFSAKTAHEIAQKAHQAKGLDPIFDLIEEASKKGLFEITLDFELSDDQARALRELTYSVGYNSRGTKINWLLDY